MMRPLLIALAALLSFSAFAQVIFRSPRWHEENARSRRRMIENSSEYKSLLKKVEEYRAQDEAREKCFKESKKRSVQSLLVLEQNLKVNCKLLAPGASKLNNADYPIIKMMTEHRVYCMKNEKEYQIILVPYFCDGDGNILESDDNSWVLLTGDEHLKDYYHAIADDF